MLGLDFRITGPPELLEHLHTSASYYLRAVAAELQHISRLALTAHRR